MAPWQNLKKYGWFSLKIRSAIVKRAKPGGNIAVYSSDIKQKASSKAGLGFGVDISLLWQPRFHGHTPRKR
jgi:hypothetical protein